MIGQSKTIPTIWAERYSDAGSPGAKVMSIFLSVSWCFALVWLIAAGSLFAYNPSWAVFMLLSSFAFMVYLTIATARLHRKMSGRYKLKVDADFITLSQYLTDVGIKKHQSIPWRSLNWAEVYKYNDELTIVLHSQEQTLEIPIWAFRTWYPEFIAMLRKNDVPILFIP